MALITADRVKEVTRTTGTASLVLDGASIGYRAFETVCANNDTCYYCVVSQTGTEWEVGLGTFKTVNTLERTTVNASSNAGSLVNFSAGTKDVFLALTATQFSALTIPSMVGNSGKFLTTNGTTASWSDNPLGTVTQVQGAGSVNGITLTGNVTSSGNLTLGGALTGVNLGTQVTGTLSVTNGGTGANTLTGYLKGSGTSAVTASSTIPGSDISGNITGSAGNVTGTVAVANGGTGTSNGSITGTGALTFAAGGINNNLALSASDATLNTTSNGAHVLITTGKGYKLVGPTWQSHYGFLKINGDINIGSGKSSGQNNAILGKNALNTYDGAGSPYVVAIGSGALELATSLSFDVAVGSGVLGATAYTSGSTGIGGAALSYWNSASGGKNTAVGNLSLGRITSGSDNVAIGYEAGRFQANNNEPASFENCTLIGTQTRVNTANDANSIAVGYQAIGDGSNTAVIGNSSITYCRLNGYTKTKSLQETVYTITDGASVDINPANGGIQVWTLGANRTPTASSFAEGQSVTLMVDDGTAYAITWSSISPTWVGGSAPTLATTGYTVIELWKRSSTIYGALVGTV